MTDPDTLALVSIEPTDSLSLATYISLVLPRLLLFFLKHLERMLIFFVVSFFDSNFHLSRQPAEPRKSRPSMTKFQDSVSNALRESQQRVIEELLKKGVCCILSTSQVTFTIITIVLHGHNYSSSSFSFRLSLIVRCSEPTLYVFFFVCLCGKRKKNNLRSHSQKRKLYTLCYRATTTCKRPWH